MEAIIFVGIQGSGKTTFYRERFSETHVRISLDLLKTRQREQAFLQTCLQTGQRFVVDNTNVRAADRASYIRQAKAAGFRVIAYFFDVPLREALRRNKLRSGRAVIPVPGVIGTLKRLERPTLSEGFDELNVVSEQEDSMKKPVNIGITPGRYANRTGEYEVLPDGSVWLIGGADLPQGSERIRVEVLPTDAAMTRSAMEWPERE